MKILIPLFFSVFSILQINAQHTANLVPVNQVKEVNSGETALASLQGDLHVISYQQIQTGELAFHSGQERGGIYESTGSGFTMDQNSPNPCNEITAIRYFVPAAGEVEFRIFNLIGKEVYRSLINTEQGEFEFRLDSREFTQGVYMYTMTFNGETLSKRMVISRK